MKTITYEDIVELRKKFEKYTETAEQHEFPILVMVDLNFQKTLKLIENKQYNIEENQEDLNAMFRVVLKTIGQEVTEYENTNVR